MQESENVLQKKVCRTEGLRWGWPAPTAAGRSPVEHSWVSQACVQWLEAKDPAEIL